MRNSIFKAKELQRILVMEGSTDRAEYWKFKFGDGYEVPLVIECDGNGTRIKCKCKHCSNSDNQYLCRYKLALLAKKVK